MGKERLQEFDNAFTVMTELAEAREQELKYEYDLLNQLELLRIFYSTTSKEADRVIVAYRNYEYATQNGLKKLQVAQNLLSIPLPTKAASKKETAAVAASSEAEIDTVEMDMDMSDDEESAPKQTVPSQVILNEGMSMKIQNFQKFS